MPFQSRQDAYRWSESTRPQGPCGVIVVNGGFTHMFLLEPDHREQVELFYLGMRAPHEQRR
jgi:hypothetical protein